MPYPYVTRLDAAIDYPARWGAVANYPFDEAAGDALAALGGVSLLASGAPASVAGKVGTARAVTGGGGDEFSPAIGQEAWLGQGDFDYWFAVWAFPTTNPGSRGCILAKDSGTAGYLLGRQADLTPIYIVRQTGGADCGRIASATTLALNAWSFVMCYFDSVAREVGISVNGGAFATTATAGSPGAGTSRVRIGDNPLGGEPYTGRVDELTWGSNPPLGIGALKTEIRDRLHSSGAGRAYPWS